jgi:hypothetical protein
MVKRTAAHTWLGSMFMAGSAGADRPQEQEEGRRPHCQSSRSHRAGKLQKQALQNKNGFRGVDKVNEHHPGRIGSRGGRTFRARIWDPEQRKLIHLGVFDSAEEAERAYLAAARERHGAFFADERN